MPRKIKYRKSQRGRVRGMTSRAFGLDFGRYGLKVLESGWITARQIEAARRAMTRHIKRGGEIWIRVFPAKPVSARPPETRMGGGKGAVDHFVARVSAGRIIFEMDGVPQEIAHQAMKLAAAKLPLKTVFVSKE